jgi:hypothetical protein
MLVANDIQRAFDKVTDLKCWREYEDITWTIPKLPDTYEGRTDWFDRRKTYQLWHSVCFEFQHGDKSSGVECEFESQFTPRQWYPDCLSHFTWRTPFYQLGVYTENYWLSEKSEFFNVVIAYPNKRGIKRFVELRESHTYPHLHEHYYTETSGLWRYARYCLRRFSWSPLGGYVLWHNNKIVQRIFLTAETENVYNARREALRRTPYRLKREERRWVEEVVEPDFAVGNDSTAAWKIYPRILPVDYAFDKGARVETWDWYKSGELDGYIKKLIGDCPRKFTPEEQRQLLYKNKQTPRCFFTRKPFPLLARAFPRGVYEKILAMFWEEAEVAEKWAKSGRGLLHDIDLFRKV